MKDNCMTAPSIYPNDYQYYISQRYRTLQADDDSYVSPHHLIPSSLRVYCCQTYYLCISLRGPQQQAIYHYCYWMLYPYLRNRLLHPEVTPQKHDGDRNDRLSDNLLTDDIYRHLFFSKQRISFLLIAHYWLQIVHWLPFPYSRQPVLFFLIVLML